MKKWKFLATLSLATVMGVACLAGCSPAASETFEGAVSETTYSSVTTAAQGFLAEELNGSTSTTNFVGYEKQADLTEEEVAALPLEEGVTLVSAEKGTISYTLSDGSVASLAASTDGVKTQTAYILQYEGGIYRYYVPAQIVGEALTKSYFEDVLDTSKYVNSTFTSNSSMTMSMSMMGQSASQNMSTSMTLKFTENAIELYSSSSYYGETETDTMYLVKTTDNGLVLYSQYEGEWSGYEAYFDSVDEFWLEYFISLDFSYFEKTSTGFGISSDKLNEYFGEMMDSMAGEMDGANISFGDSQMNYVVSEGAIASMSAKYNMSVSASYGGYSASTTIRGSASGNISNRGTTSITLPADLVAQIALDGYTLAE